MSGKERRQLSVVLSLPRSPFLQIWGGTPPAGSILLQKEMPPMPWDSRGWKGGHEEQEVLPCWMQCSSGYTNWIRMEQTQCRWWTEPTAVILTIPSRQLPFIMLISCGKIVPRNCLHSTLQQQTHKRQPGWPRAFTPSLLSCCGFCCTHSLPQQVSPSSQLTSSLQLLCETQHQTPIRHTSVLFSHHISELPLAWHSCKEKGFGGFSHQTLPL